MLSFLILKYFVLLMLHPIRCYNYFKILTGGRPKVINLVAPPYSDDKDDLPQEFQIELRTNEDIRDLEKREMGYICYYDSVLKKNIRMMKMEQLIENKVYMIVSQSIYRHGIEKQRRQIDSRVLEQEATLAVKAMLGSNAHEHYNIITKKSDGSNENEYDGVVIHNGGETNSEVYIIECAYSPTPEKVKMLLDKIETAKFSLPSQLHFSNTSKFIPILGGRLFTEEVDSMCKMKNIWQVKPSGSGYCVHRNFSTLARRFFKVLF